MRPLVNGSAPARAAPLRAAEGGYGYAAVGVLVAAAFSLVAQVAAAASEISGCPATPNCVSSQRNAGDHYIRPLGFDGPAESAWARLKQAMQLEPGLSIVAEDPDGRYLHAEATSRIFRFVDDVELWLVSENGIIEVRSMSRVGYWDFGVNRRRVERLRARFGALRDAAH